jgi:hypothetical protein
MDGNDQEWGGVCIHILVASSTTAAHVCTVIKNKKKEKEKKADHLKVLG